MTEFQTKVLAYEFYDMRTHILLKEKFINS